MSNPFKRFFGYLGISLEDQKKKIRPVLAEEDNLKTGDKTDGYILSTTKGYDKVNVHTKVAVNGDGLRIDRESTVNTNSHEVIIVRQLFNRDGSKVQASTSYLKDKKKRK